MKLKSVSIKKHSTLNEKWVQEQIAIDPSILGLGDLILRDKERIQQGAGRLDLLLQDPDTLKRYEVEIQLGAVDESHIIRTVEYWDLERKRYPQYEHAAVIVAEEITSRFLNVIQLFNGVIPLIAIKMTAYEVNGEVCLTFVKVLDEISYGFVDEDEPVSEPADRAFWEKKGSKQSLALTEELMSLVQSAETKASMKLNRHYIGLSVEGAPMNFVSFRPQKSSVLMRIKLPKLQEYDDLLQETELDTLAYQAGWRLYQIRIDKHLSERQHEILAYLVKQAREQFGKEI